MKIRYNPFLLMPAKNDMPNDAGGKGSGKTLADAVAQSLEDDDADDDGNTDDGDDKNGKGKKDDDDDDDTGDDDDDILSVYGTKKKKDDADGKDDKGGKDKNKKKKDDEDELKKFDDILALEPGSMAASPAQKFNAVKSGLKEAVTELRKLKQERDDAVKKLSENQPKTLTDDDILDHPLYKDLKQKFDGQTELVERVSLEDSPRFREKYNNAIVAKIKALEPLIQSFDEDKQTILNAKIQTLVELDHSPEGDKRYYRMVRDLLNEDWIDRGDAGDLRRMIGSIREASKEKMEAVANWKKTKKELGDDEVAGKKAAATNAVKAFDDARNKFNSDPQRAELLARLRGNKAAKYDETVEPYRRLLRQELAETVATGRVSEKFSQLLQLAVEAPHLSFMNESLVARSLSDRETVEKYRAYFKSKKIADPFSATSHGDGGGKNNRSQRSDGSGSAMVDALREEMEDDDE